MIRNLNSMNQKFATNNRNIQKALADLDLTELALNEEQHSPQ